MAGKENTNFAWGWLQSSNSFIVDSLSLERFSRCHSSNTPRKGELQEGDTSAQDLIGEASPTTIPCTTEEDDVKCSYANLVVIEFNKLIKGG